MKMGEIKYENKRKTQEVNKIRRQKRIAKKK